MITVPEGKMGVIGAGLTDDSEEGLGVEGFWRHRNLFGRGEQFGQFGKQLGHGNDLDLAGGRAHQGVGLGQEAFGDEAVERITRNVIRKLSQAK